MPFARTRDCLGIAVALIACATAAALPSPANAQEDRWAATMRRLNQADDAYRGGDLAGAFEGYLALVREFPTWWQPTLKAGIAARSLGHPVDSVAAWLDRARRLGATGPYLPLVDALLTPGVPPPSFAPSPLPDASGVTVPDPLARRLSLVRAGRLKAEGRLAEAEAEYRAALSGTGPVPAARWRLARLLRATGRPAEAAALLREGASDSRLPSRWRQEAARQGGADGPVGAAEGKMPGQGPFPAKNPVDAHGANRENPDGVGGPGRPPPGRPVLEDRGNRR